MAPVEMRSSERFVAVRLLILSAALVVISGLAYLLDAGTLWFRVPLMVAIIVWSGLGFWWVFRDISFLVTLLGMSFLLMLLSGVFYVAGMPEDWARALFLSTVIVWIVLGVAAMVQGHQERRAYLLRERQRAPEEAAPADPGEEEVEG